VSFAQTQDSLSAYKRILLQQQSEQTFKKEHYYNPVNMLDYSFYSFSDLAISYVNENNKLYKLENGSGIEGIHIDASSYKKISNNRSIWGKVNYKNHKQKEMQWNNTLDTNLLGPYIVSDSTSNSMKYEAYEFLGGYAKEFNKLSFALSLQYKAHLGYKLRDPRPKSISSNMKIYGGLAYQVTQNWKANAYAAYNIYTQNLSITFANEKQKAALYQMNGLGTWSRYFSGKSTGANYEQNGHELGFGIENTKQDFIVGINKRSNVLKRLVRGVTLSNSDDYAESNRLNEKYNSFYAIKLFTINQNKIGIKYNFENQTKEGIEVYYTDTDSKAIVKLLEKKAYNYKNYIHEVEGMYEANAANNNWVIKPFWKYQKLTEGLKEINSNQSFTYNYFGANIVYTQKLTETSSFSIMPMFMYRNVGKITNGLKIADSKQSIKDWVQNDFEYLSTNYIYWATTIKYSLQKLNNAPMFVALSYNQTDYKTNKQNNYLSVILGITF